MSFKAFVTMISKVISKMPPLFSVVVLIGLSILIVMAVKRIFF